MTGNLNNQSAILQATPRPWRRALLWLLFLGPFFFLSYGFANGWASQQPQVGSVVFGWEKRIPFLPWTIIPYWIIDALYGISLFICATKLELDTHALRLLTAQVIAVACFILFPLTFSFDRPATEGITGYLFVLLAGIDKPFNQAPSLHIALLIILWDRFARHVFPQWRWLVHATAFLIGISVLTTYQHHFIDIPTGLLLGWFCVWLWPDAGAAPFMRVSFTRDPRRWRLATYYVSGSMVLILLATLAGNAALWLLWPAVSLLFVASFYVLFGSEGFQKNTAGKLSLAAQWLLWPYLWGARINSWLWTRNDSAASHVVDGVWLGRMPSRRDLAASPYKTVIDLTAEFSAPDAGIRWRAAPSLDLITPDAHTLSQIAHWIEQRKREGPVLVTCALGYSRSAMAVITWLAASQRATGLQHAIDQVRQARPGIVIQAHDHPVIESAIAQARMRDQTGAK